MLFRNDSGCRHVWNREESSTFSWTATTDQASIIKRTHPLTEWQMYVVFMLIGLGVILLAKVFNYIRVHVYRDKDNLDTNFDAGGKVTAGLTATTIVSQWTWAATLLQSSAVATKYGISGSFWYAAGATIQILLFSMVSVQLKIRAPGAKTFLQVIRGRFGAKTHLVFCAFALLTNVIVTGMLMLGGAAVMTDLVEGLTVELSTCLVAMIILSYTYIGGLGATFYVSYFNTSCMFVIMLIFLVKIYHDIGDSDSPVGSTRKIYDSLNCTIGPDGNLDHSFLTMVSRPGLMFGIINIVGNFGTVFVDQSYWQSSVAAKPRQGVWGFLCGGLVWFAVPFTFATTIGMAYLSISSNNRQPLLDSNDVDKGLVAPAVAQSLLGDNGALMMLVLILMAVTSTGSAEVIAVTSILVYDIYQIYLKPYRMVHDANSCILCGKQRGRFANPRDKCICVSLSFCKHCSNDDEQRAVCKRAVKAPYCCTTHGAFRTYMEYLKSMKDWCLVWTTLCIIPLTIALDHTQISMGWLYLFMGVLIGSAVIPIVLCMFWDRLTGIAMVSGALGGLVSGLVVWLCVAAAQPGGLSDFIASTGDEITMLCGNLTSILVSGVVTVIVSLLTPCIKCGDVTTMALSDHPDEVWENTRDIDNPLNPWVELYAKDLNLTDVNCLDKRPSLADVKTAFRGAKLLSYIASLSLAFILVILWPAATVSIGVMDFNQFNTWITFSEIWGIVAAIFIIIIPVANEAYDIRSTLKEWHNSARVSPNARWKSKTSEAAVPGRVVNDLFKASDSPEIRRTGDENHTNRLSSPVSSAAWTSHKDSKQVDVNDIVGDNVLEINLDGSSSGNNTVF